MVHSSSINIYIGSCKYYPTCLLYWYGCCVDISSIVNGNGCCNQCILWICRRSISVFCCFDTGKKSSCRRKCYWKYFCRNFIDAWNFHVIRRLTTENSTLQCQICWRHKYNATLCGHWSFCTYSLLSNLRNGILHL